MRRWDRWSYGNMRITRHDVGWRPWWRTLAYLTVFATARADLTVALPYVGFSLCPVVIGNNGQGNGNDRERAPRSISQPLSYERLGSATCGLHHHLVPCPHRLTPTASLSQPLSYERSEQCNVWLASPPRPPLLRRIVVFVQKI